jgi:hypothetical protein
MRFARALGVFFFLVVGMSAYFVTMLSPRAVLNAFIGFASFRFRFMDINIALDCLFFLVILLLHFCTLPLGFVSSSRRLI